MEQLKVKVAGGDEEAASAAAVDGEPVSPTGQYFNSSAMSISILAIFESDKPLDDSRAVATLEKLLLPISPRFSSVIIKCEKGIQHWKKVKISLVDHVKTPVFPAGVESYDEFVGEYLSNLAVERLPAGRPPWELHLLKYPTKTAAGTAVFKLHHALGDGFSLMGALFSCLKRADDPSLPLTFPSRQQSATPVKAGAVVQCCRALARALEVGVNTVVDFAGGILKSLLVEDDRTPVRSGEAGAEFRPLDISKVVFSLHDVRQIKIKIGGTINDVISGVIFYGTQLYIKAASHGHRSRGVGMGKVTLVLLLNTRSVNGYQRVEEMKRRGSRKSSWGNQFGFIHVPVPKCKDADTVDPLSFVLKGRKIIRAKRNSLGVYLTGRMLEAIRKFRGSEVAAEYMYRTMRSSSMAVSNLIGPTEQMMMGNNPITDFYFMVVGGPQSLTMTVVSYMGRLTVAMGTERGFIDSDLLRSSMQKSFQRIFQAAVNIKN
ncbi:O-acyltransferase WSD1 [Apostasia shenzhenica]|uniref:O-acyltransferase WSD1 n=1 Tax=Apostasia shenzhenica TaxID=1088818 RepID=A0A2H9ZU83_9ASPA|nr:O-acyltransferase WSD1 [Apostasia shenzhenica]